MTESAFGVDHGDIAKFSMPGGQSQVAQGLRRMGTMLGQGAQKAGAGLKPVQGPQKPGFAGGMKRMGQQAQGAVAGGAKKAGAGMMQRPGMTGGAVGGAAGAAGGAGAYSIMRNRKKPGQ